MAASLARLIRHHRRRRKSRTREWWTVAGEVVLGELSAVQWILSAFSSRMHVRRVKLRPRALEMAHRRALQRGSRRVNINNFLAIVLVLDHAP